MLHLHRFDDRHARALATICPSSTNKASSRPCIGASTCPEPLLEDSASPSSGSTRRNSVCRPRAQHEQRIRRSRRSAQAHPARRRRRTTIGERQFRHAADAALNQRRGAPVDENVDADAPAPGQFETIGHAPGIEGGGGAIGAARQQPLSAGQNRLSVHLARRGAEARQIGFDEAGVEGAGAKFRRVAERTQEGGIGARAGDQGRLQRMA